LSDDLGNRPDPAASGVLPTHAVLSNFLSTNAAVQAAATSLRAGAEVAIVLTDVDGDWRICRNEATGVSLEPGKATDPDFELRIPPAAIDTICSRQDSDVGELGITFFELVAERDPALRINVTLHSGFIKLTSRGWLSLLARGGPRVVMWLANKGLRGPGGVATALARLKR
jgi:hypothetical protein